MIDLHFTFLGYWHCGAGAGRGAWADAVVIRDSSGLPYVPGRTVKGAIRAALSLLGGDVVELLGSERLSGDDDLDGNRLKRYGTKAGRLYFGDAVLPAEYHSYFAAAPSDSDEDKAEAERRAFLRAGLTRLLAQTAIDPDTGTAKDHSLRSVEVAMPMTLTARVGALDGDATWHAQLIRCLPLIRGLGLGRHRGLGRLEVTAEMVQP